MTVQANDGTGRDPSTWSLADLEAALRDPSPEQFGVLTGEPIVVVHLDGEADDPRDLAQRMRGAPCVWVALHPTGRLPAARTDMFDALVTDAAQPPPGWVTPDLLGPIVATARHQPLASAVLVQLLRLSATLPVVDALTAESFAYSTLLAGPEFARWRRTRPSRHRTTSGAPVLANRSGDRLVVSLNRPELHNAYSAAMRDALSETLTVAAADPSIDKVELRGEGPSFCSGGDLREFGTTPDPVAGHLIRVTRSPARLLALMSDRVVARVHGACVGAGTELPAFAARVVGAPGAWFQLPEVGMGLVPGAGGTASLPRRIGRHRTAALALSGARLRTSEAMAWGLIDEIAA